MKFSSLLVLVFMIGASAIAAEGPVSEVSTSGKFSSAQSGLYVGLDYMNLTDLQGKSKYQDQYGSDEMETKGGVSLGLLGVRLGYNQTPDKGFGFEVGGRYLQGFNKSETGDDAVRILIPEANLKYAFHPAFLVYGGINGAFWDGNESLRKYKTKLGAQAGIGFRFAKSVALNAGYTMLNQKIDEPISSNSKYEAHIQLSGLNSTLPHPF